MTRLRDSDRVIVRAPSWLGDFVMAEPALRALHRRLLVEGRGALTICAPERWLALLGGSLPGARCIGSGARERPGDYHGHDVALFLNGSARSVLCALRAGVRARVGAARGGRAVLLTDAYRPALERGRTPLGIGRRGRFPRALPRPFGAVCAELAGWLGAPVHDPRPRIVASAEGRERARRSLAAMGLQEGEPFVLVNVAARADSAKAAPVELWSAVCAGIERQLGLPVVVHAAPGEEVEPLAHSGARRLATAPELAELVALIEGAALYLTADGGPRHLAVALDRPLVVLFGPTDPRHTADHLGRTRSVRVEVDCGPCHRERCPLVGGARHACMTRIEPGAVAQAVLQALEAADRPAPLHPGRARR